MSRNDDMEHYLAICPEIHCKIIRDYKRDLIVFVSVHKSSNRNIAKKNEKFLRDNQKKIDEVIW